MAPSGAGDDGCKYKPGCLTGELPGSDPNCQVSEQCIEFCSARTPNGCDCFGCCTIEREEGAIDVIAVASCSVKDLDDPEKCPRCVKNTNCENTCGECELCPGRSVDDLPKHCAGNPPGGGGGSSSDPPPPYTCDNGVVCASGGDCPSGYYCSLGCCLPSVK